MPKIDWERIQKENVQGSCPYDEDAGYNRDQARPFR